ncbi:MAG: DUF401 family protein [Thermoprotei archaeon]|nr:DUF401 family protein [Thermoprotei archaeon]
MNSIELIAFMLTSLIVLLLMRVPLHVVLAVVIVVSMLLYGGLETLWSVFSEVLSDGTTWGLVASVFAVSWLVSLYTMSGVVYRLGENLSKLFRSSLLSMTMVPGLIGLLPVPGGALMSAPIVDSLGSRMGLSRGRRLFVNVWYRHVIVYVYPLSSVVILASAVTSVNLWLLVLSQVPIAVFMFLVGLPLAGLKPERIVGGISWGLLARDFAPIALAIVFALILAPLDVLLGAERVSVAVGVLLSIAAFIFIHKVKAAHVVRSLGDRRIYEIAVISVEIMAFRAFFLSIDLGPIVGVLKSAGVDGPLLAMVLPIFFSTISGHPTAGIAIAAPIVESALGVSSNTAFLIYASAFIGYIASPLHLCYIYTAQYYNTSIIEGYKYMVPATIASLIAAFIVFGGLSYP